MKLESVEINNFRKLKSCTIDFADDKTIFVGANNSGKTSAIDALIYFLDSKNSNRYISFLDFTISNWDTVNQIGQDIIANNLIINEQEELEKWKNIVPYVDVCLNIESDEVHLVIDLIPHLNWNITDKLWVRLSFDPLSKQGDSNIKELYDVFLKTYKNQPEVDSNYTLVEFLKQIKINTYFKIVPYKLIKSDTGDLIPCRLLDIDNPFEKILKVSIIYAQRGFTDLKENNEKGKLASQLHKYLNTKQDYTVNGHEKELLELQQKIRKPIDAHLSQQFEDPLKELATLGYPSFNDPTITIHSRVDIQDSVKHDSAVQFNVLKNHTLPEHYNGLGYQNLISITFSLMMFRDAWINKSANKQENLVERLHVVIIEEPEAHLHPQAQQIFINNAFSILTNLPAEYSAANFKTQMIVSTHSSYITVKPPFSVPS